MSALAMVRAVHFASCMMLLAVPAFSLWILPSDFFKSRAGAILLGRFQQVVAWASVVALLSAIIGFGLLVGTLMAETGADFSPLFFHTHFGLLFLLRLVLLGAVIAAAWVRCPMRYLLPLAAILLGSLAWAGHAAAHGSFGAMAAALLHLLALGIWPGELLPLALFLAMVLQTESADELAFARDAIRRFSFSSLLAVGILSASGMANACFLLTDFSALWTTFYGHLLSAKLVFFSAMMGLGAANLFLTPKAGKGERSSIAQIRRNVSIEIACGLIVLLIAGVLGLTAPG